MKVTILGAGGNIGQRITHEAARRGHELQLITSKPKSFFGLDDNVKVTTVKGDIFKTEELAHHFTGSDVVLSAYAPPHDDNDQLLPATKSLLEATKKAGVRLISVGGAGSLWVNDTTQLVDTPEFPADYKGIALAHRKALEEIYNKEEEANWTNISPAAYIFEGERTNTFRTGSNHLLTDAEGKSAISMEDFAVAILDEVDNGRFVRERFTVAY